MKILSVNSLCSIQDLGRFGHRKQGIGINGAMDSWALQTGNALLKNPLDTPAIEVTLGGLAVVFERDTNFCLTGAYYEAYLDKTPVHHGWRTVAKAGQTLTLVRAIQGMHGYVCVQSGFNLPKILDSYSTNTKANFGGLQGDWLKVGDRLEEIPNAPLPVIGIAPFQDEVAHQTLRVVKNSEYDYFTLDSQQALLQQPWKLLSSSNRMGYRLQGTPLALTTDLQMNSHGVDKGMIQVPPQGQPIVLMSDTQTTGGYPKIATIIEADIGKMAQTRFGQSQHFTLVGIEDAILAREKYCHYLDTIRNYANEN